VYQWRALQMQVWQQQNMVSRFKSTALRQYTNRHQPVFCGQHGQVHMGMPYSCSASCSVFCALATLAAAVARDRVANVLLAYKGKNHLGGAARAAEDIARQTARELLGPLLDAAVSRLGFVLRKALDIAADKAMRQGDALRWSAGHAQCSSEGIHRMCPAIHFMQQC
jgi:hypothetical protein